METRRLQRATLAARSHSPSIHFSYSASSRIIINVSNWFHWNHTGLSARGVWVEPSMLAEVEDRAKSAEGKVRHPFYRGLREDL